MNRVYRMSMHALRRCWPDGSVAWLVAVALLCMLFVQYSGLHMHNHTHSADADSPPVHVAGAGTHASPHDEAGEITLSFEGLLVAKHFGDVAFGLLAHADPLLLPAGQPGGLRPRPPPCTLASLFELRPPAHAPPV